MTTSVVSVLSHALLALLVQGVATVTDFLVRRIPNRLILSAIAFHFLIWIVMAELPPVGVAHISIVAIMTMLILIPRSRGFLYENLGMGDIKLIAYLLVFFFPFIRMEVWFLAFGAASWIAVRTRRSAIRSSLPLAPIIFAASLPSFIEALQ
jgi:Flp pilus assembly protein protease CpaA